MHGLSALAVGSSTTLLAFDDPRLTFMTKNIAGQAVTFGKDALAVAGTTLSAGVTAITIRQLDIIGDCCPCHRDQHISLPQSVEPLIAIFAGHTITAATNAIEVARTISHPGFPGVTLDGTAVSLDTAGHLVVSSKTMKTCN